MGINQNRELGKLGRRAAIAGLGAGTLGAAMLAKSGRAVAQQSISNGSKPLANKVAIVTGARANLGRGFATGLAELGANIVVHYHQENTRNQAEETGRLCQEAGAENVAYASGDLGQVSNVKTMFDVADSLGGADILINNAGAIVKKRCSALW